MAMKVVIKPVKRQSTILVFHKIYFFFFPKRVLNTLLVTLPLNQKRIYIYIYIYILAINLYQSYHKVLLKLTF